MYVYRSTRLVGKLYSKEVAERWVAMAKEGAPHGYRVYTQGIGPRDTVVMELEFESFGEIESYLAAMFEPHGITDAAMAEWWAKAGVPGGTDEIWNLYASRE
jgi:hypothetical protein